jgi:hypothetical protein
MASLIPPTLQAAIVRELGKKTPYPRSDSEYDKKTREKLAQHKEIYLKKTTRDERESYFQSVILVEVFEYWYDIHEVHEDISDEDLSLRIKVSYEMIRINLTYYI